MPDVLLQFTWEVAEHGYTWVESHAINQNPDVRWRFLTDGRAPGAGRYRVLRYQPLLAFTGLFLDFAAVDPSLEAIKSFADRFGLLGGNLRKQIPLYDQAKGKECPLGIGEHVDDWAREIQIMRLAVDLWQAARQADIEWLARVIFWEPEGSGVRIDTHPELDLRNLPQGPLHVDRAWIASTHLGDDMLARFVPGDLIKPALYRAQSLINDQLRGRASPRLLWDPNGEKLRLHLMPDGLVGALWLQFARAVERDSKFRRCIECGTWFELSPGTGRADKIFCSTACRTKTYRKRQAEAVRLHGEGHAIEEIARQLESEPATVHGWIARHSGEPRSGRGRTS